MLKVKQITLQINLAKGQVMKDVLWSPLSHRIHTSCIHCILSKT
jgi:hypothetical protein